MLTKLQRTGNARIAKVRGLLRTSTRRSLEDFGSTDSVSFALETAVRRDLNQIIDSDEPLFDEQELEGLDIGQDSEELIRSDYLSGETGRLNRRLLELLFDEEIEKYNPRMSSTDRTYESFKWLLNRERVGEIGWVFFIWLSVVMVGVLIMVYSFALSTIRIVFSDVHDVQQLLDYFVTQMGFHPPIKKGNTLVFKATWSTFLQWNTIKIAALVDGDTLIMTGPVVMIRRFRKRILAFSRSD